MEIASSVSKHQLADEKSPNTSKGEGCKAGGGHLNQESGSRISLRDLVLLHSGSQAPSPQGWSLGIGMFQVFNCGVKKSIKIEI